MDFMMNGKVLPVNRPTPQRRVELLLHGIAIKKAAHMSSFFY
jgi:hypothetical protein